MNENIKDLLKLIEEHPDLPVIPMVGQDIVADCTGEWVASFGKAEVKKMCIYGENDYGVYDCCTRGKNRNIFGIFWG